MKKIIVSFILIVLGGVTGYFVQPFLQQQLSAIGISKTQHTNSNDNSVKKEKKILYWVAPMDAKYRRDKPGKSPMGMDLVPVYENEGSSEKGLVKILPIVENNLGVRVDKVKIGQLDRQIKTVGYVTFDEEKLYHIHTRVEGWIEKLTVKASGDVIRKGQKLFELYSPSLVNAQEEYLTALRSKNSLLIQASKDRLLSLGVTLGQIKRLKKTAKVRQRIVFYAQHKGFIKALNVREGMFIKPSTEVMNSGQIDTVWVIAEVFERQSAWVKKGQRVSMKVGAFPEKTWQGKVDYIYPILNAKTRTLKVRLRFKNPQQWLKPNMFVQLTIFSDYKQKTLYVKREAIIRSGNMERVVKALGNGRFKSVKVKTGIESGAYIEVLKGLEQTDQIVTSAQFLIDSESSLTAEFGRMEGANSVTTKKQSKAANTAWIEGKIKTIMPEHNMLTIAHKPVSKWGWPDMVMDFPVNTSLSVNNFTPSQSVHFLVEKKPSGAIEIIKFMQMDASDHSANKKDRGH